MLYLCTLDAVQASAQVTVQPSGSIRLSDVQQLLLWTLADGVSPKWAFIQARSSEDPSILKQALRAARAAQQPNCSRVLRLYPRSQWP